MPTTDFFQPGTTYQRGRWQFQCLAVAPRPINQEMRAVGFLYCPTEPDTATGLDLADWEHGEWIAAVAAPEPVDEIDDCTCVEFCDEDPRTACRLSGIPHVHPEDRKHPGTYGPCPVHPGRPGDQ